MPESIVETNNGLVLIANGIDPVLQWDRYATSLELAGVTAPTVALTFAGSGAGSLSGTYTAYLRYVDRDGNFSNLSPVSNQVALAGSQYVSYTGVQIPTQPSVVRRQILRNTDGQMLTFYVDVDTTDLGSTAFLSDKTDAVLRTQTIVTVFDEDTGLNIANVYTPPPSSKPFLAHHQGRMYYAGMQEYREGCVRATSGSAIVQGYMTEWPESLVGRFLYIDGATAPLEIASVNPTTQSIGTTQPFFSETGAVAVRYAAYSIRPADVEEITVYFSEANLPTAVPATNAFTLPVDHDKLTGLMDFDSFLFLLKRRRMYKLTTRIDPVTDGRVFAGISRGCVNNRCWVIANEQAYLLDEAGVYRYSGDREGESATNAIQDIFRRDGFGFYQINWAASRTFHASHSPQEEVIRWFVCLGGDTLPRHALSYGYATGRWWVDQFQHPIGASCLGRAAGAAGTAADGLEQVYLGSSQNKIFSLTPSGLDGCVAARAVRTTVSDSDPWTVTLKQPLTTLHIGATIAVARGRARGQTRRVAEVVSGVPYLDRPWDILPQAGDVVQVGGVPLAYRTRRIRYIKSEAKAARHAEINYYPVAKAKIGQTLRLNFREDYLAQPLGVGRPLDLGLSARVQGQTGDGGNEVAIDASGYAMVSIDGGKEGRTDGPNSVLVGIDGVSGPARVRINSLVLAGVAK